MTSVAITKHLCPGNVKCDEIFNREATKTDYKFI